MAATGTAAQQSQTGSGTETETAQAQSPTGEKAPAKKSADPSLPEIVIKSDEKPKAKKAKAKVKPAGGDSPGGAVAGAATEAKPVESDPVNLNKSLADTGTTIFDAANVKSRTLGGGDANTFLRNLPNVQYQNDTSEDAGMTPEKEIDTRPMLFSIMGGRTYENNIILNGVSINTNTGTVEDGPNMVGDDRVGPLTDVVYGLHPQTVYVPVEFLDKATIIDSNASAKYGEFLGGAVIYDMAQPPTDRYHASVSYSRETDEMVHYIIGTVDGSNPNNRKHPEFTKNNLAVSVGAPITTDWSFITQASRKTADTSKQKDYEYFDQRITEDSDNIFFRFATAVRTDVGRFLLDSSLTQYSQLWQAPSWRDLEMEVESHGWSNQIEHRAKVDQIVVPGIGLGGVNIMTRAYYNDSNTYNDASDNVSYNYQAMRRTNAKKDGNWLTTFVTDDFDDWCRPLPASSLSTTATQNNTICRDGGTGDIEQGQTDIGLQHETTGNLFWGSFLLGGEIRSIEGRRARPEEYISYSAYTTTLVDQNQKPTNPKSGKFECPPGDDLCTSEYYNSTKTITPAFETTATINSLHFFSETDQTLAWLNVRAGMRFDYEDYQKNPNFSPRLAATVTPFDGLSFTGGYNRYYQADSLYYAVRDGQPRSQAWYRGNNDATPTIPAHNTTTGEVAGYSMRAPVTNWTFTAEDLATPFKDEYTGAVRLRDPLTGGQYRVRYVERHGSDEYSPEECGSSLCNLLTNNGTSYYESVTAEYSKYWSHLKTPYLSSAGISANITWSDQKKSKGTYYYDDAFSEENRIYYKGQRYNALTFDQVTGNLDIPVRVGATLTTSWFNDALFVDFNAGYNFSYQGVYDTDEDYTHPEDGLRYNVYDDRTFDPTLMVDLHAQYNITDMAAIELEVDNLLDTDGNSVATSTNPWTRGRSFWLGTKIRM